jgi:hypothetical protein
MVVHPIFDHVDDAAAMPALVSTAKASIVPRPVSPPGLGKVKGQWAGSDVGQLGLVAERDDVLG